jgi:hypothetical protein
VKASYDNFFIFCDFPCLSVVDLSSVTCLLTPETLYETRPKWNGFLMIKLAALATGGQAEQRTAEPQNNEPQNFEGWNRCALSFY